MSSSFAIVTRAGAIALIVGALCQTAAAQTAPTLNQAAVKAAVAAHEETARAAAAKKVAAASASKSGTLQPQVVLGALTTPSSSRAYSPSCLADGLPFGAASSDPNAVSTKLTLPVYNFDTGVETSETDTLTVFRVPCSGGASATLVEIDRPATLADVNSYAYMPSLLLTSASGVQYYSRLAPDQNTVYADTQAGTAIGPAIGPTVYVFEYYSGDTVSGGAPDYNQAFSLTIDTLLQDSFGNEIYASLSVPAYSASSFNYPSAANPMPIGGYLTGSWYDPDHSGEGILTQVYDNTDGSATRIFAATWYTFDTTGAPFWLSGAVTVPIGTTQVSNLPLTYRTGGGLAGNFTPPLAAPSWGTLNVSFPSCNQMTFTYNGTNSAPVPSGSGSKTFTRLGSINDLACQ